MVEPVEDVGGSSRSIFNSDLKYGITTGGTHKVTKDAINPFPSPSAYSPFGEQLVGKAGWREGLQSDEEGD